MNEGQQLLLNQWVFILTTILLIDNLYSIRYFHYTYIFELKRRFALIGKEVPIELSKFLQGQIKRENGSLRNFMQSAYIPWFVICILGNLWYLPLIVTAITGITNIFYSKPYVSPLFLMLNLLVFNCCYVYGVVSLFLMK